MVLARSSVSAATKDFGLTPASRENSRWKCDGDSPGHFRRRGQVRLIQIILGKKVNRPRNAVAFGSCSPMFRVCNMDRLYAGSSGDSTRILLCRRKSGARFAEGAPQRLGKACAFFSTKEAADDPAPPARHQRELGAQQLRVFMVDAQP